MRFTDWLGLNAHLEKSFPDRFSPCYLLLVPDATERVSLTAKVVKKIGGEPLFLEPPFSRKQIFGALSPTLLESRPVVVLKGAEKLDKKEAKELFQEEWEGVLILASSGKIQGIAEIEKRGVILDFSNEKPWEKQKRLFQDLEAYVQRLGKTITPDAVQLLFDQVGQDVQGLEQELDKLACFVGERSLIERNDLFQIGTVSQQATLWQVADDWVWAEGRLEPSCHESLHSLLFALRSQLQIGLKIASLLEANEPLSQWSSFLPKIWPKILEKRIASVRLLGASYFAKGLHRILEVEQMERSGVSQEAALIDFVRGAFYRGR